MPLVRIGYLPKLGNLLLAAASATEFGVAEAQGAASDFDPMQSSDPEDYFQRSPYESLFKRVEKVHRTKESDLTEEAR